MIIIIIIIYNVETDPNQAHFRIALSISWYNTEGKH